MPTHLYISPAASGKTRFVLDRARAAAQNLATIPRVCVPTSLQARATRQRLATMGGALGIRVLTFDGLYAECLQSAREAYTQLDDPVLFRLIRAIADELDLQHYAAIKTRPGFAQALQDLFAELKAEQALPEKLRDAMRALGDEPRLRELVALYDAYQTRLRENDWADRAGLGWLAVGALNTRAPQVARDWSLLVIDGFDNFTQVQIELLRALAPRVGELIITLTGALNGERSVYQRSTKTRARVEAALALTAESLPTRDPRHVPPLAHLEANLFNAHAAQCDPAHALEMLAPPDRAAEARAALRWLKARVVSDQMCARDLALIARNIEPYRPFIAQSAREFGMSLRFSRGLPVRENPAIAALLDLLRIALPDETGAPSLPRRRVVEAWRSPYLNWNPGEGDPVGIVAGDADALDLVARWARVIGGLEQWRAMFARLAQRAPDATRDDEARLPANLPTGDAARILREKFERFVARIVPPHATRYRDFTRWLETLIGLDPALASDEYAQVEEPTSLRVVACARDADGEIAERDVAALRALKDILRGLVWAEQVIAPNAAIDFARFVAELTGAIDAATFTPPPNLDREEILVADAIHARGLALRAVAILGLAEGEFPATLSEDPFLRDADRAALRALNFSIDLSTESAEKEFFYEAVTRAREKILLTRPRLADNGAEWQTSPFWEEILRLVKITPRELTSASAVEPDQVASPPELLTALAARPGDAALRAQIAQQFPARVAALDRATRVLAERAQKIASTFDGDLQARAPEFARRFDRAYVWSASRLENYRACPHLFFVDSVLKLEPRVEPAEGLDVAQLGNVYHRILKATFESAADKTNLDALIAALARVAPEILDAAPRREGFRATAWWAQTRAEIVQTVRDTLTALVAHTRGYTPLQFERYFSNLVLRDADDELRVRGVIDRMDRAPDGRLLIVDYKTGGPSAFTARAVIEEGKKLQLALYALAARDALKLGAPADGFYWHIVHAEPSKFSLGDFDGGANVVFARVNAHAFAAARGARAGQFAPTPPDEGCPAWCPASEFCWHFDSRF
jgi:ATP-dependent helicase/DNAse subunit B